jgi:hypothetical protein
LSGGAGIVLIVFPIFGMFFGVLLKNGWSEQLRTKATGDGMRGKTKRNNPMIKGTSPRGNCLGDGRKRG